ncbi:MAG: Slp family lipoprotein [Nitrospirota bacterium]
MRRLFPALALIALVLSGCAYAISGDLRRQARTDVPFGEEVVQNPLDRYGAVTNEDVSGGRFLVRSGRFLDPLIYEKGREVTVAGVLKGSTKRRMDGASYTYPVLEPREIYLWREEEYYYGPGYYPYGPWYDPWWDGWPYRRYGPWCDPFWDPWCP